MKKIFLSFILILSIVFLTSCENINSEPVEISMKMVYHYGFFDEFIDNSYQASLLYDYNSINFEIDAPEKQLIAGDVVNLKYRGSIICQESFPGRMFLEKGSKILSTTYYYTTVVEIASFDIIRNDDGQIISLKNYIVENNFVILDNELNFIELEKYTGTTLFASFKLDQNKEVIENQIAALYAYNPR